MYIVKRRKLLDCLSTYKGTTIPSASSSFLTIQIKVNVEVFFSNPNNKL